MSSLFHTVKEHIAQRISVVADFSVTANDIERPPNADMGDLAFGCFRAAKESGKNPAEIAKSIAEAFGTSTRYVESATAAGPFVNFTIKIGEFAHQLVLNVEQAGESYGSSTQPKHTPTVFEYAQPNTHKEFHVGHIRNLLLGASLVKILRHDGWNVIPVSYHGDVGAHVAKCLWRLVSALRKKSKRSIAELTTEDAQAILERVASTDRNGSYLGRLYTEASTALEEHPEIKDEISAVQIALEKHDPAWNLIWEETRRWSLEEMKLYFQELGVNLDRQYLESEVVDDGQRMVDELLAKNIAKESQGAIIVDLEDQKLGVFLVRKSDGTSLYSTKDLALAFLKQKEYPTMSRSVMLVDLRQSLYFNQLFATLKMMGYTVPTEHVGYEFVTLKEGAMSSRKGNIVTYKSFRDEMYEFAWKQTKERHADWNEGQVSYTAWALAKAGMSFGMLKQDSDRIMTFDLQEALSFEGDTGPYVQYALVRLHSILKKAGSPVSHGEEEPSCHSLKEPQEKALAIAIAEFGDVVARSAAEMRPSIIANWCADTARLANAFYRDLPVLDADPATRNARLRFIASAYRSLSIGVGLLGIPVPEEM
ncbi:MAG: arginine--tRNA ligase [Patescibacteria group bacterium]